MGAPAIVMLPMPVSVLLDGPFGCTPGDRETISLTERPVGNWSTSCLVRVVAVCTDCEMFSSVPVTWISSVIAAPAISASSVFACAAPSRSSCLTGCRPWASKVTAYSPAGSDGNR